MRPTLVALLSSLLAVGTVAGQDAAPDSGSFSAAYLEDGLPPALDFIREKGFTNFRTATLADDSLTVYFGLMDWFDGTPDVGWAAVLRADTVAGGALGFKMEPRERGALGAEFEVSYDWGFRSLPLHVRLVPDAGLVLWRSPSAPVGAVLAPREVEQTIVVGEPMPDLSFRTADGAETSLSALRGQTVVVNWWHSKCGPCIVEMPGLNGLVERYGGRGDVVFLAVTDDEQEAVDQLLSRHSFTYRQAFVDSAESQAVFDGGYPEHLVIDPSGTVTFRLRGGSEDAADDVERALVRVIGS